jgi:hypothetical protein
MCLVSVRMLDARRLTVTCLLVATIASCASGRAISPEPPEPAQTGASTLDLPKPHPSLAVRAVRASSERGDIVVWDERGRETWLTVDGTDDEPALSPDGTLVVFRRFDLPSREGSSSLVMLTLTTGNIETLVTPGPDDGSPCEEARWVSSPTFSLDGARVFFSAWNGQLGAACAVELERRTVSWVMTAIEWELIERGPYRGHFFAIRREHDGLYDPYYELCYVLHSVTGQKLRAVDCAGSGPHEGSLQNRAARRALGL